MLLPNKSEKNYLYLVRNIPPLDNGFFAQRNKTDSVAIFSLVILLKLIKKNKKEAIEKNCKKRPQRDYKVVKNIKLIVVHTVFALS